jgi:hypothetical protein
MTTTKQWKVNKIFHLLFFPLQLESATILKMCMLGMLLGTVVIHECVCCIVANFCENFKNYKCFHIIEGHKCQHLTSHSLVHRSHNFVFWSTLTCRAVR